MKYAMLLLCNCYCMLQGFSQDHQTITLIFLPSQSDSYKNYEAVIDEVSYYSENVFSVNKEVSAVDRNTIWLNNFAAGQHTIEIYAIKKGSNNQRAGNYPVFLSSFNVRNGFDTKIAVRSNGQVQFSERMSNNSNQPLYASHNDNYSAKDNASGETTAVNEKINENNSFKKPDQSADVTDVHERRSHKRTDADTINNNGGDKTEEQKINSSTNNIDKNNDEANSKIPMDDNKFKTYYEMLRNQWRPGQKMKTLTNEFLNTPDNFTTAQAKQLIQLVTEEGNRLALAKSSYHTITDPENFSEVKTILRSRQSKEALDDFINTNHD